VKIAMYLLRTFSAGCTLTARHPQSDKKVARWYRPAKVSMGYDFDSDDVKDW